jgi:hypothetical protein
LPARVRTYCCPEMEKDDRVGVMISGSVWSAFAESTFTFEVVVVVVVDTSNTRSVRMGIGNMQVVVEKRKETREIAKKKKTHRPSSSTFSRPPRTRRRSHR